ncbi:hypothetical protein CEXT_111701 [Caerostris extrusa]|uniref:Uncharacterized protein n=1 Tax=Caerostris extrusa TaxID=172846 RepID=A0AAV4PU61_CAEEX|nr:hypothetical protein CEXT_111701 [Caerostris extrusa]
MKPKSLTLRKTPVLEPPNFGTFNHQKKSCQFKVLKSLESNNKEGTVPALEMAFEKRRPLQLNAKIEVANWVKKDSSTKKQKENVGNSDESDFSESQSQSAI